MKDEELMFTEYANIDRGNAKARCRGFDLVSDSWRPALFKRRKTCGGKKTKTTTTTWGGRVEGECLV